MTRRAEVSSQFRREFESKENPASRYYYRRVFLRRATALVPDMLTSLADVVEYLPPDALRVGGYDDFVHNFERVGIVMAALAPWQEKWHLTDGWVAGMIYDALTDAAELAGDQGPRAIARLAWKQFDDRNTPYNPVYPPVGGWPGSNLWKHRRSQPLAELLRFETRWYPLFEAREDFVRWTRKRFDAELSAYVAATERLMQEAGFRRIPKKRGREGEATQHIDWLIEFHIRQRKQEEIAAKYKKKDPKTIATGIRKASALVGFQRRGRRA